MPKRQWFIVVLSAMFLLLNAVEAKEQDDLIEFDITSEDLATALLQFSVQSGLQLFYLSESTEGKSAGSVVGRSSSADALKRILKGSGLTFQEIDPNTVAVVLGNEISLTELASPEGGKLADNSNYIDEILVTGSHIPSNSSTTSSQPLRVVSSDSIARQAVVSTDEIIRNMIFGTGSQFQLDALTATETVGTSNINLRGLGLGSTLILIGGNRQTISALATQEDGSSFVDVSSLIPVIAIDRIDVLSGGAAAIYGSDAVAGVVNFIANNQYEGLKIQVEYQSVTEGDHSDSTIQAMFGQALRNGHIMVAGSFLSRQPLASSDRKFTSQTAISSLGQPGTFLTTSDFQVDPNCSAAGGLLLETGFCGIDITPFFQLSPREERLNLYSAFSHRFGANVRATLELGFIDNSGKTIASPSFPFSRFNPIVPASHPENPFGEDVVFFGRVLGADSGPSKIEYSHRTQRISGGLSGDLASDWKWQAKVNFSDNRILDARVDTLGDRLVAALNGTGGPNNDQFFDPFGFSSHSADVLTDILADSTIDARSSLSTFDVIFYGAPARISDRKLQLVAGMQTRYESLKVDFGELRNEDRFLALPGGDDFRAVRDIFAAFVELQAPLLHNLTATFALRYENYGDGMKSVDPMIAAIWHPQTWLTFRTSFGNSFRAPSLLQTDGISGSNRVVDDPFLGLDDTFRTISTKGDSSLTPEEASAKTFGLVFRPSDNVSIGVDYWRYDYEDVVAKQSPQEWIDQAYADTVDGLTDTEAQNRVILDPASGSISKIITDFVNVGSIVSEGLDFSASLTKDLDGAGSLTLEGVWSYVDTFRIQETPLDAPIEAAGNRNTLNFARTVIKSRGTTNLTWRRGAKVFDLAVRYFGSYKDDANMGATVPSHSSIDLLYSQDLKWLEGVSLTIGLRNALDEPPPRVGTSFGYDTKVHDPRGRMYYVRLAYDVF